jgi:hypothetical protein
MAATMATSALWIRAIYNPDVKIRPNALTAPAIRLQARAYKTPIPKAAHPPVNATMA